MIFTLNDKKDKFLLDEGLGVSYLCKVQKERMNCLENI